MTGTRHGMSAKVLVDTSVWIAFFRHADSAVSRALRQLLQSGFPCYTGIIATELYRGAKTKKEMQTLNDLLSAIEYLETEERVYYEAG